MTSHRGANPDIQDIGASLPGRDGITVREFFFLRWQPGANTVTGRTARAAPDAYAKGERLARL